MKTIPDHTSNAFIFILIISYVSLTSSSFLNYFVVLTKLPKMFSPIELLTMLFYCLNLTIYSTDTSFLCCLVSLIIARDSVDYIYGYVARIGSWIDWSIAPMSFKGSLRILSYSWCYLIIVCIRCGQNYLNIISNTFPYPLTVYCLFSRDSQLLYPTFHWKNNFRCRSDRFLFYQYTFTQDPGA